MKQLSDEEVDALPDGTPILLKWDEGMEPRSYTLKRNEWGGAVAVFYIRGQEIVLKDPLPSALYKVYLPQQ